MTAPQHERKRYICFKVHADAQKPLIEKALIAAIKQWIGDKDFVSSKVLFMPKLFNATYRTGIIACNHTRYLDIREIVKKTTIQNNKVDVFFVGGTLKKAQQRVREYNGTTKSPNDGI